MGFGVYVGYEGFNGINLHWTNPSGGEGKTTLYEFEKEEKLPKLDDESQNYDDIFYNNYSNNEKFNSTENKKYYLNTLEKELNTLNSEYNILINDYNSMKDRYYNNTGNLTIKIIQGPVEFLFGSTLLPSFIHYDPYYMDKYYKQNKNDKFY